MAEAALETERQGVVLSCGRSSDFQLGFVTNEKVQWTLRPIRSLTQITQVAAGAKHNLALDVYGRVFVWGSGNNGKLGFGDEHYRATPVHLDVLGDLTGPIDFISAGEESSACISRTGKAFTWGSNANGQLGINSNQPFSASPKQVAFHRRSGSALAKTVSCGVHHTLFLMQDGAVMGCGSNIYGELGVSGQRSEFNRKPVLMDEVDFDQNQVDGHDSGTGGVARARPCVIGVAAGWNTSLLWTSTGHAYTVGFATKPQRVRFKDEFSVHIVKCSISKNRMYFVSDDGKLFVRERKVTAKQSSSVDDQSIARSIDKHASPESRSLITTKKDIAPNKLGLGFWTVSKRLDALLGGSISDVSCSENHTCVIDEFGRVLTWGKGDGLGDLQSTRAGEHVKQISSLPCANILSGAFASSCGEQHTLVAVGFVLPSTDASCAKSNDSDIEREDDDMIFEMEQEMRSLCLGDELSPKVVLPKVDKVSGVPTLAQLAEQQISKTLDCFNFQRAWEVAELLNSQHLLKTTERFILDNLEMLMLLNPSAMREFEIGGEIEDEEEGESTERQSIKVEKTPKSKRQARKRKDSKPSSSFQALESKDSSYEPKMVGPFLSNASSSHNEADSPSNQLDFITKLEDLITEVACGVCNVRFKSYLAKEIHLAGRKHKEAIAQRSLSSSKRVNIRSSQLSQSARKALARKEQSALDQQARSAPSPSASAPSWVTSKTPERRDLRAIIMQETAAQVHREEKNLQKRKQAEASAKVLPSRANWGSSVTPLGKASASSESAKTDLRTIIQGEHERSKSEVNVRSQPLTKNAWGLLVPQQ